MTQVNRDPGDETKEEQCEEMFDSFGEQVRCRHPKGHKGDHNGWYFHPEGFWGQSK